jgi:hypothetical protein
MNLSQFSSVLGKMTGDASIQALADDNMLERGIKRFAGWKRDMIEETGLPQVTQDVGQWIAQKVGVENPEYVGQMTRELPNAAVDLAAMFIPYVGPGYRMAAAGAMSGATAMEGTDSWMQTGIAAATPKAASMLFDLGKVGTLKALQSAVTKMPWLSKLGLEGGREVTETLTGKAAAAAQVLEGTTQVGRKAVTVADRLAGYAGGQAAAGGAFFGRDVFELGADAFTPEHLLGTVLNQVAFAPMDIAGLVKPEWITAPKTEAPVVAPDYTPVQKAREEFGKKLDVQTTDFGREYVRREFGLDAAEMLFKQRAGQQAEVQRNQQLAQMRAGLDEQLRNAAMLGLKVPSDVEAALASPESSPDLEIRNLLTKYNEQRSELMNKPLELPRMGEDTLFGLALDELGLAPDGSFLTTPLEARTVEMYQQQFGGKLTEQQIGDLYRSHKRMTGVDPDMTPFKDWKAPVDPVVPVKGKAPSETNKVRATKGQGTKGKAKKAEAAAAESTAAKTAATPEEVAKVVAEAVKEAPLASNLELVRNHIGKNVVEVEAATGVPEATIRAAAEHVEGAYITDEGVIAKKEAEAPDVKIVKAATKVKRQGKNPPNDNTIKTKTAEEVGKGAPPDEGTATAAVIVENAGKTGKVSTIDPTLSAKSKKNSKQKKVKPSVVATVDAGGDTIPITTEKTDVTVEAVKVESAKAGRNLENDEAITVIDNTIVDLNAELTAALREARIGFSSPSSGGLEGASVLVTKVVPILIKLAKAKIHRWYLQRYGSVNETSKLGWYALRSVMDEHGLASAEQKEIEAALDGDVGKILFDETAYAVKSTEGNVAPKGNKQYMGLSPLKEKQVEYTERMAESRSIRYENPIDPKTGLSVPRFTRSETGGLKLDEGKAGKATEEVNPWEVLPKSMLKDMSPEQRERIKQTLVARQVDEPVGTLFLDMIGFDRANDPFLAELLVKEMTTFEAVEQANAVKDGARRVLSLMRDPEALISNEMKKQGVVSMTQESSLLPNLAATLYNWVHDPSYWLNSKGKTALESIEINRIDGGVMEGQDTKFFEQQLISKVGLTRGMSMEEANAAIKQYEKDNPSFFENLTFEVKPFTKEQKTLMTSLERGQLLEKLLRSTVNNFYKAEFNEIKESRVILSNKKVLMPERDVTKWDFDEKAQEKALLVSEVRAELSGDTAPRAKAEKAVQDEIVVTDKRVPEQIRNDIAKLSMEEPNSVFQASLRKKVFSPRQWAKFVNNMELQNPGDRERFVADPTATEVAKIGKDGKIEAMVWVVTKANNPNMFQFENVEASAGREAVDAVAEAAEEAGLEIGEGKLSTEEADAAFKFNTEGDETVDVESGPADTVNVGNRRIMQKEIFQAQEILREIVNDGIDGVPTENVKILAEVTRGVTELTGQEVKGFIRAMVGGNPALIQNFISSIGHASLNEKGEWVGKPSRAQEKMLELHNSAKEAESLRYWNDRMLIKDRKLTPEGQNVFRLLVEENGSDPEQVLQLLEVAGPELRKNLSKLANARARTPFSELTPLRDEASKVLEFRTTRELSEEAASGISGWPDPMAMSERERQAFYKAIGDLTQLANGKIATPVRVGDQIYYKPLSGQALSKYEGYIQSVRTEPVKPIPTRVANLVEGKAPFLKYGSQSSHWTKERGKSEFSRDSGEVTAIPQEQPAPKEVFTQKEFNRLSELSTKSAMSELDKIVLGSSDGKTPDAELSKDALRFRKGVKARKLSKEELVELGQLRERYKKLQVDLASTTPLRAALRGGNAREQFIDNLVSPEILAEHMMDAVGIPRGDRESYKRDFLEIVELSRVDDVGFGRLVDDISAGIFGAADSPTRAIFLSDMANFKSLMLKDRTKATHFVLAHELGHFTVNDALSGRYGQHAQEALLEAQSWVKSATPEELANTMDTLFNGALPKEFRNDATNLIARNLSSNEFLANAAAMHSVSSLAKPAPEFMTLLPTPIRKVFDWIAGHYHKLVSAANMFFAARGNLSRYKDAKNLLNQFEQIRHSAREAEQNIAQVIRVSKFFNGNIAEIQTGMMDFVDPSVLNSKEGQEWLEFATGDEDSMRFGSKGNLGASAMRQASRYIAKTGDLARLHKEFAPFASVFRDTASRITHMVIDAAVPIFGERDAADNLSATKTDWKKVSQHDGMSRVYKSLEEYAAINEVDYFTKTPDPADPSKMNYSFDGNKMDPQTRALFKLMSSEQQGLVTKLLHQRRLSQEVINKNILKGTHQTNVYKVAKAVAMLPEFKGQDGFDRVEDYTNAFYEAYAAQDIMKLSQLRSLIAPDTAAKIEGMVEPLVTAEMKMASYFEQNPFFLSFKRFKPIVQRYIEPVTGRKVTRGYDTEQEAKKSTAEMEAKGYQIEGPAITEKSQQNVAIDRNSAAFIELQKEEGRYATMVDNLGLTPQQAKDLKSNLSFASSLAETMAKEGLGFGTNRQFREGYDQQSVLQQHLAYAKMSARLIQNQALTAAGDFLLDSPAAQAKPEVRSEFLERVANFKAPDNQFGAALNRANAVWFIGFNFPSHVVEMMQPLMTLLPEWVAQGHGNFEGVKELAKTNKDIASFYAKVGKEKAKQLVSKSEADASWKLWDDPEIQRLMKVASERQRIGLGHVSAEFERVGVEQDTMLAHAEGRTNVGDYVTKPLNWYANKSMNLYGKFTQHNAMTALLMGYKSARKRGMSPDQAVEEALNFEWTVNKSGGRADRQAGPWGGNKLLGHLFYSLQGYTMGWMGQLGRYISHGYLDTPGVTQKNKVAAQKALKTMVAAQLAGAGILGFPFVGAMIALLEKTTDMDIKGRMFEALTEVSGDPAIAAMAGTGVANSILASAGLPADVHSRLSIGGILGVNAYDGYSPTALMGPTASMVNGLFKFGKSLSQEQDLLKALSVGGPVWQRKWSEMAANEGKLMIGGQSLKELEGKELALYKLGFANPDYAKLRMFQDISAQQGKEETMRLQQAASRALDVMKKNPAAAQQALFAEAAKLIPDDVPKEQQVEMVQVIAKRIASKAAEMQTQKKLPVDFRQGANSVSAVRRAKTAAAMGVQPPAPQNVQRSIINDETLQAFGMAPPQRDYSNLVMQDLQQRLDPSLFRSQLQ